MKVETLEPRLVRLNGLAANEAEAELLACCGARAWAERMAAARPFADRDGLLATAERIWWELDPADWRQAFAAHPRIGENRAAEPGDGPGAKPLHRRTAQWSAEEQSGARSATASALADLAAANRAYEARFSHLFLICATGRSVEEMLAALRERMGNDPETELSVAAGEQVKITRLRLTKLLR
jgi:OHCU decarboxylase